MSLCQIHLQSTQDFSQDFWCLSLAVPLAQGFTQKAELMIFQLQRLGCVLGTILQTPMKMDEKTRELQPKTLRLSDEARDTSNRVF